MRRASVCLPELLMPSPAAAPRRWQVFLAFAAIYIIWGSSYLGISFAVQTLPPFIMSAARFLLAGTLLLLRSDWRSRIL